MEKITLEKNQVHKIKEVLLEVGSQLNKINEDYVWPEKLNRKFTRVFNTLEKALKS